MKHVLIGALFAVSLIVLACGDESNSGGFGAGAGAGGGAGGVGGGGAGTGGGSGQGTDRHFTCETTPHCDTLNSVGPAFDSCCEHDANGLMIDCEYRILDMTFPCDGVICDSAANDLVEYCFELTANGDAGTDGSDAGVDGG